MTESACYMEMVPLKQQACFSFESVFRESTQYVRNYTLPFDMIGIVSRCKDEESSVITNLLTGERVKSHLNDVHLIPCGLPQCYAHTTGQEHLSIHFRLELYPGIDVFAGQKTMFSFNSEAVRREAEEIFALEDSILKLARCQELALRICRRFWPEKYPFDLERMALFDGVLEYIRRSATARMTIEELAAVRGCSPGTFTREFHRTFGMAPKWFLQQELYRKACRMLLAPNGSVKSVAGTLMFSSEFYFSKFFRRMSGIPPKEYRRNRK